MPKEPPAVGTGSVEGLLSWTQCRLTPGRVECTVQLENYLKENFEISFKIQDFVVIILLLHLN